MAGFAAPKSVITSLAGFGSHRPQPLGRRTAIPAAFRYALAVSRRILVACWMRRSDQPSRPRAKTVVLLFVQDIGHAHGAYKPPRESMSRTLLSLAGFQVILSGRFWGSSAHLVKGEDERVGGAPAALAGLCGSTAGFE